MSFVDGREEYFREAEMMPAKLKLMMTRAILSARALMRFTFKMGKTSIRVTILIIIGLGVLTAYIFQFHGGLSDNQNDWGSFGSYIGGIAAIMNVVVFVWLTVEIHRANKKQKDIELVYQKKLLFAQFQKTEIEKLQRLVSIISDESGEKRFNAIVELKYYLTYLDESKNPIFTKKGHKLSDEVPFDYKHIMGCIEIIVNAHLQGKVLSEVASDYIDFSNRMDLLIWGLQDKLLRDITP